jgi:hypothetical protein
LLGTLGSIPKALYQAKKKSIYNFDLPALIVAHSFGPYGVYALVESSGESQYIL